MSANINFNKQTGQHSFFSVKEKAWHGLGQIVSDYVTSAEAIRFAGLDYEVAKRPLFTTTQSFTVGNQGDLIEGQDAPVTDYYATMRMDNNTVLGVVGKNYQIVQNFEAFDFFDAIVGGGHGIKYETAGALGKGERIFITAKLPDYIRVGADDLIEKYLFLTMSHDGTGSITVAFTPIRIVCANTLAAALKDMKHTVKIRHTANAKQRLMQVNDVMGLVNTFSPKIEAEFQRFATVRITDTEVKRLIQMAMMPNKEVLQKIIKGQDDELSTRYKNVCEDVFEYAMSNPTQQMDTTKGTVFGAYNAITGYYQNVLNFNDAGNKLDSILQGGTASQRTQRAFDLCTGYIEQGSEILMLN